jgi:monoamine oxidase
VVLRGIGTVPVLYGRLLSRIDVVPAAEKAAGAATAQRRTRTRVKLTYSSGTSEVVDGVVLTLPPPAMLALSNLPRRIAAVIKDAFTTVSMGVLYATWASMDVWWPKLGFFSGMVAAPEVPIGRVCVTAPNALRCSMSGTADVQFWNDMFIQRGERATATAVAAQLSSVFATTVPVPASVVVKSWMQALSLWNMGSDRASVRAALERPWGADVPIWWACSDISDDPGWVEGAVSQGASAARGVAEFVHASF